MTTEPASSLFPNRPIRPLPKRRLKERLTPEVADSIKYPPLPHNSTSLFSYPYPLPEEYPESGSAVGSRHERKPHINGIGHHGKVEGGGTRQSITNRATPQHSSLATRPKLEYGRYGESMQPPSAASSADGYDSLENTNNKKRKIPTAGDSAPGGGHVISDSLSGPGPIATHAQSAEGQDELLSPASAPYYGSGSLGSGVHNVPGPGRGRYGRPRSGKNSLRPLYDSTNSWAGRSDKSRPGESTGIISNAIAKAEKLPPPEGQDNISLLHQPPPAKRNPASTLFTFTCDSQVPGSLAWPGADRHMAMPHYQGTATANHNKENWSRAPQSAHSRHPGQMLPPTSNADASARAGMNTQGQHPSAPPKPTRRSATKEYLAAARARRRETQLYNKRHPPNPEDMWVCHFCEYEWIFGHPPEALVRAYEIKERKQRQVEEQRRAQWERMKKGKHKGKKNSKLPTKNNAAAQDLHHHGDGRGAPNDHYDHGAQEDDDEYYDDEYYEDEDYDGEDEVAIEGPGGSFKAHTIPGHSGDSSAVHDGGGT
ncbi:uncharacterized protein C8A04DRAFT_35522 [Dichotomopilus funicola]|uniref:Uncharacterized protein n=1 Tax=Dichotomopilus funicola TaxID=1934379 RepID=A0AAN6V6M4_9PEZI|nr:hypothetical protein C8A04DRAFT_35522 [Dichotomopilus funicola]